MRTHSKCTSPLDAHPFRYRPDTIRTTSTVQAPKSCTTMPCQILVPPSLPACFISYVILQMISKMGLTEFLCNAQVAYTALNRLDLDEAAFSIFLYWPPWRAVGVPKVDTALAASSLIDTVGLDWKYSAYLMRPVDGFRNRLLNP